MLLPISPLLSLCLSACLTQALLAPSSEALVSPAQTIGEVPRVEPSEDAERGDVLEWTSAEGRPYWYRLPKSSGRAKPNLILMLHGTGGNQGWSFWNYGIESGEFRGDDIVVSPDGVTPGNGDTFNFLQGKDDGEQIAGLIELFRSRFEINNVYLYGHSQGAFFCFWFGGAYPELIDGYVAHAGNVLDIQHPKLAKEKLAVCILHGRADAVVPVECAERSRDIFIKQGYAKLRCEIVEGLTETSGHWPLPTQVAEMFEWLDSVSARDAGQALEAARISLAKTPPDFTAAVRALGEAVELLDDYEGEDAEQVTAGIEAEAERVEAAADVAWALLAPAIEAHDGGSRAGPFAADTRWFRRAFSGLESFEDRTKPLRSLFKKHDKAFDKLAGFKDKDSKKYARALLDALEESYLGLAFDDVAAEAARRVEAGWAPVEDLTASLADVRARLCGTEESAVVAAATGRLQEE